MTNEVMERPVRPPFDNRSIRAPIKGKPHICKREGWWRVSGSIKRNGYHLYVDAHKFINKLTFSQRTSAK